MPFEREKGRIKRGHITRPSIYLDPRADQHQDKFVQTFAIYVEVIHTSSRDWAASAQRRGSNVDLAARAEAQAETTESRCGGCLCCCGPRPDVLVEHEAQREARIAAHRGVLPGLEPGAGDA